MSAPIMLQATAANPTPDASAEAPAGLSDKSKYLNRLRRLEGQIRGIDRMIVQDRYCLDVLTQVSAVSKALNAVALGLLEEHLRHCIRDAVATGQPVSELKIAEVTMAVSGLVRS